MGSHKRPKRRHQYRHSTPVLHDLYSMLFKRHPGKDQTIFITLLDSPEGNILRYQNNYLGVLLHVLDSGKDTFTIRTWLSAKGITITENALLLQVIEADGIHQQEEIIARISSELQGFTSDKDMHLVYDYASMKAADRDTAGIRCRIPGLKFKHAFYEKDFSTMLSGEWRGFDVYFSTNNQEAKLTLTKSEPYLSSGWRADIRTTYSAQRPYGSPFYAEANDVDSIFCGLFENLGNPIYTHIVNSNKYGRHELQANSMDQVMRDIEKTYRILPSVILGELAKSLKSIETEDTKFLVLPG